MEHYFCTWIKDRPTDRNLGEQVQLVLMTIHECLTPNTSHEAEASFIQVIAEFSLTKVYVDVHTDIYNGKT